MDLRQLIEDPKSFYGCHAMNRGEASRMSYFGTASLPEHLADFTAGVAACNEISDVQSTAHSECAAQRRCTIKRCDSYGKRSPPDVLSLLDAAVDPFSEEGHCREELMPSTCALSAGAKSAFNIWSQIMAVSQHQSCLKVHCIPHSLSLRRSIYYLHTSPGQAHGRGHH